MTSLRQARRRTRVAATEPRVGLFGLLGQGNIGNDGSLEAVVAYLKERHPDAFLDGLCPGPEQVTARCGISAARWHWYHLDDQSAPGIGIALKCLGLGIDAFRTAAWVRRHNVVIVPGMGVLETSLPLRPWQTPYRLFVLCVAGRLFRTKVALVSVGASVIRQRLTRRLIVAAARLAHYRSFRDDISREAMRQMGLDTSGDAVYPDVAFALPIPHDVQPVAGTVGLGVMDYYGGSDDRGQANELHASYIAKMKNLSCGCSTTVTRYGCSRAIQPTSAPCRRSSPTCGRNDLISTRRGSSPILCPP